MKGKIEKRTLSAQKKSPRTEPDIPKAVLLKKGYQGVLSPIGKCIRSEIENRKCVVHAVVQGDEKARAINIAIPTQLDHGRDSGVKGETVLRRDRQFGALSA
jgi:hypothetical protein